MKSLAIVISGIQSWASRPSAQSHRTKLATTIAQRTPLAGVMWLPEPRSSVALPLTGSAAASALTTDRSVSRWCGRAGIQRIAVGATVEPVTPCSLTGS